MMKHIPKNDFPLASLTILAAVLFSSCGMPTTQILPVATGDNPPAGKCLIVVDRESTSIGAWVDNEVYDNKTHVGTLTSGGKLAWLRDPGPMALKAEMKMLDLTLQRRLNVEAGKTYHYKANPTSLIGPGKSLNDDFNDDLEKEKNKVLYVKVLSQKEAVELARLQAGDETASWFVHLGRVSVKLPDGSTLKKENGVVTLTTWKLK
jgi:hypothetical protein